MGSDKNVGDWKVYFATGTRRDANSVYIDKASIQSTTGREILRAQISAVPLTPGGTTRDTIRFFSQGFKSGAEDTVSGTAKGIGNAAIGLANLLTGYGTLSLGNPLWSNPFEISRFEVYSDTEARAMVGGELGAMFSVPFAASPFVSGASALSVVPRTSAPNGSFYSVAFETTLSEASYPGGSYYAHFKEANAALAEAMTAGATFARSISEMGISVPKSSAGTIARKSPTNWVWHHAQRPGVMQLVPKAQHPSRPGGMFWESLHPGGLGGMRIWNQ